MFLHYTSHTQFSCTLLLLLIRFRTFYPNRPYLAISLFLFAAINSLFQLINIMGFGDIEYNKLDGNCYVISEGGKLSGLFSIGFITMMVYCWVIWALIGISIYFT